MDCNSFDKLMGDYSDGHLEPSCHARVTTHVDRCAHCKEKLSIHRDYLLAMRDFEAPQAAPGQLAHMLREAHLQGEAAMRQHPPRHAFLKGFATASALAVAVVIGITQYQEGTETGADLAAIVSIAEYAFTHQVTVIINVPSHIPAAKLALDFPASLRMEGLEDLSHVAWNVDLEEGANVLTLPVTVAAGTNLAEPLSILATVSYDGEERDFELPVELLAAPEPQHGILLRSVESPSYHI